jgi:PPK2 family polyphosphate:nucleotide phosphotransferase
MAQAVRVDGSEKVRLKDIDPNEDGGLEKEKARERTDELGTELAEHLDLLYYATRPALLIILQGIDTSGKDGTIRRILTYANVQSCRVEPFKVPTEEELAHDFLWRVHKRVPGRGSVTIFNRSHYEDVLVARVHELVPREVWKRRYDHINRFEELVHDNNTLIVKFYLHISKDEQEERLIEREQDAEKSWKLSVGDWKERELWDDYVEAYEEMLNRCGTVTAPWYVVPANRKWYRDLAVVEQLVEVLRPLRQDALASLEALGKQRRAEIQEFKGAAGGK